MKGVGGGSDREIPVTLRLPAFLLFFLKKKIRIVYFVASLQNWLMNQSYLKLKNYECNKEYLINL